MAEFYSLEELEQGIDTIDNKTLNFVDVISKDVKVRNWDSIVFHHSYKPDVPVVDTDYAKVFNRFHLRGCGWVKGLGYQFVITWNPINPELPIKIQSSWRWKNQSVGAHSLNRKRKDTNILPNQTSIGICVVGNFDINVLPVPVYPQIKEFVQALCTEFKISRDQIYGHYQFEYKTCPGKKFDISYFKNY